MPKGLDNFLDAVGDTIKTAPTIYEDALQPTIQEAGKILALIPQTVEAALLPLRKWNIEREYKFAEIKKLLEHKLQNIDPEKVVTPEAYVAVPAIQAISYSMDSEELRNLYANLLAKSMNSDTKNLVHPCFVEIIKQMSPIDAFVFKEISFKGYIQTVDIYCSKYLNVPNTPLQLLEEPIEKRGYEGLTHITKFKPDIIKVTLDNLLRLRLIEEQIHLEDTVNEEIKLSPYYISITKQVKKLLVDDTCKYEESPHSFYTTNLGKSFQNICLVS